MLELHQVHKAYVTPQGPRAVLAGVDLTLAVGESLALMGESGSASTPLAAYVGASCHGFAGLAKSAPHLARNAKTLTR